MAAFKDSSLADALSTSLFLLPLDKGRELLASFGGEAVWVDTEGNAYYSDGFKDYIR